MSLVKETAGKSTAHRDDRDILLGLGLLKFQLRTSIQPNARPARAGKDPQPSDNTSATSLCGLGFNSPPVIDAGGGSPKPRRNLEETRSGWSGRLFKYKKIEAARRRHRRCRQQGAWGGAVFRRDFRAPILRDLGPRSNQQWSAAKERSRPWQTTVRIVVAMLVSHHILSA